MAQAAHTEHCDEVGRPCAGHLDRLVGRDARAGERGGVDRVNPLGHLDDVAGVGARVLAEATVDRVAHVLLLEAERLPAGHAVVAGAAGVGEPRHGHTVAQRDLGHAGAGLDDDADALVAGNEGWRGLHGPVAVSRMDVGVAEARRLDLHQDLTGVQVGLHHLLHHQRLGEVVNDRGAVLAHALLRPRDLHLRCSHRSLLSCAVLCGTDGHTSGALSVVCGRLGGIGALPDRGSAFPLPARNGRRG